MAGKPAVFNRSMNTAGVGSSALNLLQALDTQHLLVLQLGAYSSSTIAGRLDAIEAH